MNRFRDKTTEEKKFDVIVAIMHLEQTLNRAIIKDELVGDSILIGADKFSDLMEAFKAKVTDMFSGELGKKDKRLQPLQKAIMLMNNIEHGRGDINALKTEDLSREIIMGEIPQQAAFGGIEVGKN